jgi:hypothetical protein
MDKIEQIKKLADGLSKESLCIFGGHIYDLLEFYSWAPEIKWMPSAKSLVLVHPEERDCYDFLCRERKKILGELLYYLNKIYAEKVFGGIGAYVPDWCYYCLNNHIRNKDYHKYTKYNDDNDEYWFVLPEDKKLETIWG